MFCSFLPVCLDNSVFFLISQPSSLANEQESNETSFGWGQTALRQMTRGILKVLSNMSSICSYQIVVDYTSITLYKPTLPAINLSPVTPLPVSDEEDKNSISSWKLPTTLHTHMFHVRFRHFFQFQNWKPNSWNALGWLKNTTRIIHALWQIPSTMLEQTDKKTWSDNGSGGLDIHERAEGGVSSARSRVHISVMTSSLFGKRELRLQFPLL